MADPTFTTQFGLPDPTAAPLTVTELVTLLNALSLPASIAGYSNQIVTGSGTPGVDDQDKIWFRIDPSNNPLGFWTFVGGNWRPVYTGRIGQITWFTGVPTGLFDTTGKANIGSVWDGWAFCTGQNGTVDLRNKFLVSAQSFSAGNWFTTVAGGILNSGGAADHLIALQDLPDYNPVFKGAEYDPGSSQSVNHFIIDNHWLSYGQGISDPNAGTVRWGNEGLQQTPVPTVPPFVALAALQFIGYLVIGMVTLTSVLGF